jgi:hypothetical protein
MLMTTDNDSRSVSSLPINRGIGGFKPYTLKEYKELQKHSNFDMGGLGPNIGADEWQREKDKREKMLEFANKIRVNSMQRSPVFQAKKSEEGMFGNLRNSSMDSGSRIQKPLRMIPERSGNYNELQEDDALYQLEQQYESKNGNFGRNRQY